MISKDANEDVNGIDLYEIQDYEVIDVNVNYDDHDIDLLHLEEVDPQYINVIAIDGCDVEVHQIYNDVINDDEVEYEDDTLISYCEEAKKKKHNL